MPHRSVFLRDGTFFLNEGIKYAKSRNAKLARLDSPDRRRCDDLEAGARCFGTSESRAGSALIEGLLSN
jgi:hypothetical protein